MWPLIVAAVCAGLFAGAAIYINAVEHPARLSCGNEVALREFAPSYRRATVMQAVAGGRRLRRWSPVGVDVARWLDRTGRRSAWRGRASHARRDIPDE